MDLPRDSSPSPPPHQPSPHGRPRRWSERDPRARLEHAGGDRAAVAKARHATFDTLIRYAASTTLAASSRADVTPARAMRATVRGRVRGRAHAVAAVFASFTGHNYYRRHRLFLPQRVIAARRMRGGDRLSVGELAGIATLPVGYVPSLTRAGARAVPPPPVDPPPGAAGEAAGRHHHGGRGGRGAGR